LKGGLSSAHGVKSAIFLTGAGVVEVVLPGVVDGVMSRVVAGLFDVGAVVSAEVVDRAMSRVVAGSLDVGAVVNAGVVESVGVDELIVVAWVVDVDVVGVTGLAWLSFQYLTP
jgi:hypothetical protein